MTSVASHIAETAGLQPKSTNKIRKRAAKACLSCRARKVRCDVSQRGNPCMNCYLDSETCVVTGRASRLRKQREPNEHVEASHLPYSQENTGPVPTAEENAKSRGKAQPTSGNTNIVNPPENRHEFALRPSFQEMAGVKAPNPAARQPQISHRPQYTSPPDIQAGGIPAQQFNPSLNPWMPQQPLNLSNEIVYSYYPFLVAGNLSNILPQDVNYLESQGCFRVPTRAVLDEFVQQYFLHVHPFLPLINEGDFWDLYCQHGSSGPFSQQRMSLLVFQSMIFATSNFVSRTSINALGYPSIRVARAALYRRAKLLYDFESESSPLCIAQAALLLSFWSKGSGSGIRRANSTWLTLAIQHAKLAEAHHYSSYAANPTSSSTNDSARIATHMQAKRQNILKRLWWCCIIRDRILAFGVRRSIQITLAHFDLNANSPLDAADLADEVDRSKVHNAETKRSLIEILALLVDLCVLLTDMLVIVYPLDDAPAWGRLMKADDIRRLKDGKMALIGWYKIAKLRFPMSGASGRRQSVHDSVILYTNLLYMYYHSSRVALCHHEVIHLAAASAPSSLDSTGSLRDASTIQENRHELQAAASGVTECLNELIQLRLARWLPISAVACTALPLVLHILDVKLSSPRPGMVDGDGPDSQAALKQHRLSIFIEAMKTYQPQYDGVDRVSETVRHIINLAQLDGARPNATEEGSSSSSNNEIPEGANGKIHDWTDILTSHPSLYLRLALTMDLSLSKDRLPEEGDFPACLRGILTSGTGNGPIRALLGANRQQPAQQQQQQQQLRPVPGSWSAQQQPPYQRPKPSRPTAPRAVPPIHTMKKWLETDRAINYGIQSGIDMELDEPETGGLSAGASVGYTDSESSYDSSVSTDERRHHHEHEHQHQHQHRLVVETQQQEPGFQPFTAEEMEVLEAHVLDAFTLHSESPPGSEAGLEAMGVFGEALGLHAAGEWVEQVRKEDNGAGGEESGRERGDEEIATVLMDAIKEQAVGAA